MKNIGIWLDKEKAHIVNIENGKEEFITINSNVENFRIGGGSGTRFKGGPQDVVQDSKYLEREKHQLRIYFKQIASQINHADAIVIFGPAEANEKFRKELQLHYKSISDKVRGLVKVDSMTNNQVKALVRDFFKVTANQ